MPMLPEDSLLRLTLSNGDGLIGMTLIEPSRQVVGAVTAKNSGLQVQEEKLGARVDGEVPPTSRLCCDICAFSEGQLVF